MNRFILAAVIYMSCQAYVTAKSQDVTQGDHSIASKIEFSVAAIKRSKLDDTAGWRMEFTPDGFSARNVPLRKVIQEAYGIYEEERLSAGPNDIESLKFDIEAKIDDAAEEDFRTLTLEQRRSMLKVLLASRFGLSTHLESKELSVYALILAKGGPKLQTAASQLNSFGNIKGHDALVVRSGRGSLQVKSFAMSDLALALQHSVGRIVVDKTGLPGRYDFSLRWTPMNDPEINPTPDALAPSIFTALQEQLGLKLDSMKSPIDTIVVDHLALPSAN